ncbi:MAG: immunity protein Tsi6 family protein, partial [Alcanivorax sp.]|uniref:immunity protein Tsi6 family protein n=1 Tax=Alcanivorax sp. TaxID=1872427 RepID=UPI003DA6E9BD
MSQEDIKARVCKDALAICNERIATDAWVALPEIMDSIQAQLAWLVSYFEGASAERSKLFGLTSGHYAVREVDEQDREFVEA